MTIFLQGALPKLNDIASFASDQRLGSQIHKSHRAVTCECPSQSPVPSQFVKSGFSNRMGIAECIGRSQIFVPFIFTISSGVRCWFCIIGASQLHLDENYSCGAEIKNDIRLA